MFTMYEFFPVLAWHLIYLVDNITVTHAHLYNDFLTKLNSYKHKYYEQVVVSDVRIDEHVNYILPRGK